MSILISMAPSRNCENVKRSVKQTHSFGVTKIYLNRIYLDFCLDFVQNQDVVDVFITVSNYETRLFDSQVILLCIQLLVSLFHFNS